MKVRNALLFALCVLALACGGGDPEPSNNDPANNASNNATNNATSNVANNTTSTNAQNDVTVTVGVYRRTGDTTYERAPVDDLVFRVGVECQTWSREVANPTQNDSIQTAHDHFNAADDVVYANGELSWVEYGPEHSQEDIDATCAAGMDGKAKSGVNDTDYYFDGNMGETDDMGNYIGFYLKIESVE